MPVEYQGNIGVVGFSGSGKSTLGEALKEELGWKNLVDAGQYFRDALDAAGLSVQEGSRIPLSLHRLVDAKTSKLLKEAHQTVIVGRTISFLAEKQGLPIERYVGVNVKSRAQVVAERARVSWNRKKKLPEDTPLPTISHVRRKIALRNNNDLQSLREVHGIESYRDLFGVPPNHIEVRSDRMTIYDEVSAVMALLMRLDLVEPVKDR